MEEKSFKLKRMYKRYVNFSSNFFIFMKFSIAAYLKIYPITFFYFAFSDLLSGL